MKKLFAFHHWESIRVQLIFIAAHTLFSLHILWSIKTRLSHAKLTISCDFALVWFLPHGNLLRFPALGTGWMGSRAWHLHHFFFRAPYAGAVAYFSLLTAVRVFPRLNTFGAVAYFPALVTSCMFCFALIGSLHYFFIVIGQEGLHFF